MATQFELPERPFDLSVSTRPKLTERDAPLSGTWGNRATFRLRQLVARGWPSMSNASPFLPDGNARYATLQFLAAHAEGADDSHQTASSALVLRWACSFDKNHVKRLDRRLFRHRACPRVFAREGAGDPVRPTPG